MTSKERIYATLNGQTPDRIPVTPIFMAWAANFIGKSYRDFYLNGEILAQAQIAVTEAFQVDQISSISDPWREAQDYGMQFDYPPEGVGIPRWYLIKTPEDIRKVKPLDYEKCTRMKDRTNAVRIMAEKFGSTHSILGWVEGPLAEYVGLRGLTDAMIDLIDRPEIFTRTAEVIVDNAVNFAKKQIEAGADMVGVGDAAASLV